MKRYLDTMVLLVAASMLLACGGCKNTAYLYQHFQSKGAPVRLAMAYPDGWMSAENKGKGYWQVIFSEPKNKDKVYKAAMILTVYEAGDTLAHAADAIAQRRMNYKEAGLVSRKPARILGQEAVELVLTYKTLDRLYIYDQKNVNLVRVKERILVFKIGAVVYVARYENTLEEFQKLNNVFSYMLTTVKFAP